MMCNGGNSAHALHYIQHQALSCMQHTRIPIYYKSNFALFYYIPIFKKSIQGNFFIQFVEDMACCLNAGNYSIRFDEQPSFSLSPYRNTGKRSMIPLPYIFL